MKLKSLEIVMNEWGPDKGKYTGKIRVEGDAGSVAISLNPETCAKLFAVVAGGIVQCAKEVAEQLTVECVAALPSDTLKIA